MDIEITRNLSKSAYNAWKELLLQSNLEIDINIDKTVLVWDNGILIATGSRYANVLKLIAVDKRRQGEDLASTVITALRKDAFENGYRELFIYTKPQNKNLFSPLLFYPVAQTERVLLLEDKKNGIGDFLNSLSTEKRSGKIGAAVMNCNPFTNGHKYLIETAALQCDFLYIFVLSEEKSTFSFADRIEMVKRGTKNIKNVAVLPTGPYLISSATFPTYFLKDAKNIDKIRCDMDIEIFSKHFAPHFNISRRFAGSEPFSEITAKYNEILSEELPKRGVEFIEIPRKEANGVAISATYARQMLKENSVEKLKDLLPKTTIEYLKEKNYIR